MSITRSGGWALAKLVFVLACSAYLLSIAAKYKFAWNYEPARAACTNKATGEIVNAHAGSANRWDYKDENGFTQSITSENSHLWRCVSAQPRRS